MEWLVADILERIDKDYPDYSSQKDLTNEGINQNQLNIIQRHLGYIITQGSGDNISYLLTSKGIEFLNAIRMKKTIVKLDKSINDFSKNSNENLKILDDTLKLMDFSNFRLTSIMLLFTVLLIIISIDGLNKFGELTVYYIVFIVITIVFSIFNNWFYEHQYKKKQ